MNIGGTWISNLRFAEDIGLMTERLSNYRAWLAEYTRKAPTRVYEN